MMITEQEEGDLVRLGLSSVFLPFFLSFSFRFSSVAAVCTPVRVNRSALMSENRRTKHHMIETAYYPPPFCHLDSLPCFFIPLHIHPTLGASSSHDAHCRPHKQKPANASMIQIQHFLHKTTRIVYVFFKATEASSAKQHRFHFPLPKPPTPLYILSACYIGHTLSRNSRTPPPQGPAC